MESKCDLSGYFEFTNEELEEEIDLLLEDISNCGDQLRRIYCLRTLLLQEKERRNQRKEGEK